MSDEKLLNFVDLTKKQDEGDDLGEAIDEIGDMDDYDLLDANIDPLDWKSLKKKEELEREINLEQLKIHFKSI